MRKHHNLGIKLHSKKMVFPCGRGWIELSVSNLRHNLMALNSLCQADCSIMAVVKANAYGHGAVPLSKALSALGITSFCVATILEGIRLRRGGIKGEILVLGYTHPRYFSLLRNYELTQTVVDCDYGELLNKFGKKLKVQVKIDTGMHRLGERADRMTDICRIYGFRNLDITGTYTHLSSCETTFPVDAALTKKQGELFYRVIKELNKQGYCCGKIHLLASYGLINYPEFKGDYARTGIALYGVLSNRSDLAACPVNLRPVLSLKARVALTKDLYAGEGAGYGSAYIAERDCKIAVVTAGYADGIPRALSCGRGNVLIHQQKAPIVGRICMDQMLVDVTGIPNVKSGDIVVLTGKSGRLEITAYDLAEAADTITNELLCRLSERLDRILC